jgi:glycosyltransferase involved in cell wall biosynthesis
MRIGIDTRFYSNSPTGIGIYSYELCLHLLQYKDLELVLFLNPGSPILIDKAFQAVEKVIIKEKLFSITELFTLPAQIRKKNLDIYHSPSIIMPFLKKIKYIMTIHDLIHLKFPEDYGVFHRLYYKFFVKRAALQAEKIITDSLSSKKDIEIWLKAGNISLIYLAASEKFSPHLGITDIFSRFSISRSKFILYVGNNRPNKNLKKLIRAYAIVKNKIPGFSDLVLTCDKNKELEEIIRENFLTDDIRFTGPVSEDELILLYSFSQFLVLPSLYEGFGLPVLEAMSCGCPVTCSDRSSLPEIAGDSVLYFNPGKIEDIAEAMGKMFLDTGYREFLSEKGKQQAKKFSWKKTAEQTYELYKEIINSVSSEE